MSKIRVSLNDLNAQNFYSYSQKNERYYAKGHYTTEQNNIQNCRSLD